MTPRETRPLQRKVGVAVLVCSLVVIAAVTLTPVSGTSMMPFWCLRCGERPAIDVVLNIFLFVPLGLGLGLYGMRFRRAALFALTCTFVIEMLQFWIPGRDASARDIAANFAGGLAGILIGRYWRALLRPSPNEARRIATTAIVMWVITQAFTAWAMQLAPPPQPWWAQLRPERDNYPVYFKGKLLEFALGTTQMRESDELPGDTSKKFREELLAGVPLRVRITEVENVRRLGAVAILSGGPVYDVAWLAFDGRDGVYGVNVRGSLFGLRTPSVRIANVASGARGDTIELRGSYYRGIYELRSYGRDGARGRLLPASPSLGWAFILPFPLYAFGPNVIWLTAIYLVSVWSVLGYWSSRSSQGQNRTIPTARMVAGAVFGLSIIPILFGIPVAHWSEWMAVIVGMSAGWMVARKGRRAT